MKQDGIRNALGWRYSLARECFFYWRMCINWRAIWNCRLYDTPLAEIHLRNGIVYRVAVNDARFVALPLLLKTLRDHIYTRYYAGTPRVVADVGAHLGFFTLFAAQRWPQAQIFALEPAPSNYERLAQNCELNRAVHVTALPLAAGRADGQAELLMATQSDAHSLYAGSEVVSASAPRVSVKTIGLGGLLRLTPQGKIDFLKVDCEGAEYEFLVCPELLREHVGYVAAEYHEWSGRTRHVLAALLREAGFELRWEPARRLPTGMIWGVNPRWRISLNK